MNPGIYIALGLGIVVVGALVFLLFVNFKGEKITEIQLFATVDKESSHYAEYIIKELIYNSKMLYSKGIQAQIYIICDGQDSETFEMVNILKEREQNLHIIKKSL
ncbi:MAG: hypothetical protein E7480_07425 [Ruminococcaceae bacterium]|nr:hypothetical protein [Oscillospiraceae bacterium]